MCKCTGTYMYPSLHMCMSVCMSAGRNKCVYAVSFKLTRGRVSILYVLTPWNFCIRSNLCKQPFNVRLACQTLYVTWCIGLKAMYLCNKMQCTQEWTHACTHKQISNEIHSMTWFHLASDLIKFCCLSFYLSIDLSGGGKEANAVDEHPKNEQIPLCLDVHTLTHSWRNWVLIHIYFDAQGAQ